MRESKRQRRKDKASPASRDASRKLAERHAELTRQIRSLEDYISTVPAAAAERQLDSMQTIPPPEVFDGVARARAPEPARPLRAQAANARSHRQRNMLVFIVVAAAFCVFAHWLSRAL